MRWWFVLAMVLAPVAARADGGLRTQEFRGTVGPLRIGGALTIRNERTYVAGHYFYVQHLTDIPLVVSMAGNDVALEEPGGGAFHLHLVGLGKPAGQAVAYGDAVGLAGTWTRNGKILPVELGFEWVRDGAWPSRLYDAVTLEPDDLFEARVRRFIRAPLDNDRKSVADLVSYPLRVNGRRKWVVKTKAELMARWNTIFTPPVMKALRDAVPHEMVVHDGQAMISGGQVWFDKKGAVAINQL